MKKKNYKKKFRMKPFVKYTIYTLILMVLFFFSSVYLLKGYSDKTVEKVSYSADSYVDYKVYLKENNFFETPYLEKNSTYISSLIDYIDVNFNYKMDYSKIVSGKYSYFVQATMLANKANDVTKNYWSKVYKLSDEKEISFQKQASFIVNNSIKIDYQKYNDLLAKFKKEYGLPMDGILRVELIVKSDSKYDNIKKQIKDNSNLSLEIPLTQSSVDIGIKTNSNKNNFKEIKETNNEQMERYKDFGFILLAISLIATVFISISIYEEEQKKDKYVKELKKILTTYDGIIVNVASLKDLSKYNIIYVKTFNELLDAHSEVRMPINYIEVEKDKESIFIIIKNDIAWVYKLINK